MRDTYIVVGAAVCALCGILFLGIAGQIQPEKTEISSVHPGDYTACEGIVCEAERSGENLFVRIFDGASISVPFFNFSGDIEVGDLLYVEGRISLYNKCVEIIPETYTVSKVWYGICCEKEFCTLSGVVQADLADGVYGIIGDVKNGRLEIERELLYPFTSFQGRVSSTEEDSTFRIYGYTQTFSSVQPVSIGEISGFGIQIGGKVTVLYYQWEELPVEPMADARKYPEGYPVKISGTIESVRISKGHIFLVVTDSTGFGLIPLFRDVQSALNPDQRTFSRGENITVIGVVHFFNGTFEVLPEAVV